jgi:hypothetical protein
MLRKSPSRDILNREIYMKKAMFILFIAALAGFLTGCASSGRAALLSERVPIALVSVVSNGDINWKGEDPINPDLINPAVRRTLRSDPELTILSRADELINTAERLFRETMATSPVISLADKEIALSSSAYQQAQVRRFHVNRRMVTPEGYLFIDSRDRNFPAALARETGIQRSMFVEFNFSKSMATGFGKSGQCRADLEMTVIILCAQGRTLFRRTYDVWSRATIGVSGGVYTGADLLRLFEGVIIDACYDFLEHFES